MKKWSSYRGLNQDIPFKAQIVIAENNLCAMMVAASFFPIVFVMLSAVSFMQFNLIITFDLV